MAFAARNKKNNQSSTLITKTNESEATAYYDTFTDETKKTNTNSNNHLLRITQKRCLRQPSTLLSPILSPTLDRFTHSTPVTPRKENKLTQIKEKQSDATAFSFKETTADYTVSSTPSMQKSFSNTSRSRNNTQRSYKSRPQTTRPNSSNTQQEGKPFIIHKKMLPQMWENADQSISSSLEDDIKETTHIALKPPPKVTMKKLRSLSTDVQNVLTVKLKHKKKLFPATPEISVSKSKSNFPDTEQLLKTSREYNKQFILDRIQNRNRTAALFRRRSVLISNYRKRTVDTEYQPPDMNNTLQTHTTFSIHEEAEPDYVMMKQKTMDYNQFPMKKMSLVSSKSSISGKSSSGYNRKQLVYIGGINDRNRWDVRDRLFDLFEMWGDRPELNITGTDESWQCNCIYIRFPSIAQAVDGVNVFDGVQPNGYSLRAKLVLSGSQMVYIDGLDGDWNEEIFHNFVDISSDYKVSVKRIIGDKAYAFVQFAGLEAVQSAIDRFDGESEIDGKLVRWVQMVKAYIGKIGANTTIADIQNELSEFDASFKYLPVEIRKSREPIYFQPNAFRDDDGGTQVNNNNRKRADNKVPPVCIGIERLLIPPHAHTHRPMTPSSPSMPTILSREQSMDSNLLPMREMSDSLEQQDSCYDLDEEKSSVPMNSKSSRMELIDDVTDESDISSMTEDEFEYEWHYYVYVWFWTKDDAMRAQSRFDCRICFGSQKTPVRFLLLNDVTQKVYVSGLMDGCCTRDSIARDVDRMSKECRDRSRKKCMITYRENGNRPYAYLRFGSQQARQEAMRLFDDRVCFGNELWPIVKERKKIHLELVRHDHCGSGDLLSYHLSRNWNAHRYCYLTICILFLPFCVTYQWALFEYNSQYKLNCMRNSSNTKDLSSYDLLQAMFCFSSEWRSYIHDNRYNVRCIAVMITYALYFVFYLLIVTLIDSDGDWQWHTLLPLLMYIVIAQLFVCWCSVHFNVVHPAFHILQHVSMYFEDYKLYSIQHIMASEFVALRQWDQLIYPWEYPIAIAKGAECRNIVCASLIYAMLYLLPFLSSLLSDDMEQYEYDDICLAISAAILMFTFCFLLLSSFNTIISRTRCYWQQVHGITELITYRGSRITNSGYNNNYNFLKLDNEENLFAWLSLRGFIHRKGDVVFCGLEMNALFLLICVFLNLVSIVVDLFRLIQVGYSDWATWVSSSGSILSQICFLSICLYYIVYIVAIGYWFGKENEYQLNRVEKQKLYLYTERMKQLLKQEKYKLCDNSKITKLKMLLNSMDALIQHVETNQITPQLWGIKMNDFKWKIALTVIAAVAPSIVVRWMLDIN